MDLRSVVARRLGPALIAAVLLVPALAHPGAQEAAVDCTAARAGGAAPVGCFVLVPSSPYTASGTGGSALGADAARLSRLLECAVSGDSTSAACQEWEAARAPDAVMCID